MDELKKVYESGMIPTEYLFNSANRRMRLVRGLLELIKLDTHAHVIRCRTVDMFDKIKFVLKSLGQKLPRSLTISTINNFIDLLLKLWIMMTHLLKNGKFLNNRSTNYE